MTKSEKYNCRKKNTCIRTINGCEIATSAEKTTEVVATAAWKPTTKSNAKTVTKTETCGSGGRKSRIEVVTRRQG